MLNYNQAAGLLERMAAFTESLDRGQVEVVVTIVTPHTTSCPVFMGIYGVLLICSDPRSMCRYLKSFSSPCSKWHA